MLHGRIGRQAATPRGGDAMCVCVCACVIFLGEAGLCPWDGQGRAGAGRGRPSVWDGRGGARLFAMTPCHTWSVSATREIRPGDRHAQATPATPRTAALPGFAPRRLARYGPARPGQAAVRYSWKAAPTEEHRNITISYCELAQSPAAGPGRQGNTQRASVSLGPGRGRVGPRGGGVPQGRALRRGRRSWATPGLRRTN